MCTYKENDSIFFENDYVKIEISGRDSLVKSVFDKVNLKEIKGEDTYFIHLILNDKTSIISPDSVFLNGNVLSVSTKLGCFDIEINCESEYITFELISSLPKDAWKCCIANVKYSYDYVDKLNCGAVGIAITYWANPCFYPDSKSLETKAEISPHLKDVGAKYALIVAPINKHKDIIKKVSLTIDKHTGIVNKHGGAWGQDSYLNYGNTVLVGHNSEEFLNEKLKHYNQLGVSHIDFHKGNDSFYQGDFKYVHFNDGKDFKNRVVDRLEKNNMYAGLHTYSAYIDYDCDSILSDPKWQKQLSFIGEYTLSEDVNEDALFLPTVESTDSISKNYTFFSRNTPYILVGTEIMEFENATGGFKIKQRALRTTKNKAYKKGTKIYHIDGFYHGIHPAVGSELFYQIARNTAHAFNEGGYKCIYLDALEGTTHHCTDRDDDWFYIASFVCEMLANCNDDPMVECSHTYPFLWPIRGRFGAYDTVAKGYKHWNRKHVLNNQKYNDLFATTTLGWYDFYPAYKDAPANVNTKYHHTDDAHYIGSLALMYDLSMVYNEFETSVSSEYPALFRNVAIYRIYDDLRKKKYFSEQILDKVRTGKYEYQIKQTAPDEYNFVEKDYQLKRIHNLSNSIQNKATYSNPFKEQTPFVRIEALLSGTDANPITILECNSNEELVSQTMEKDFDYPVDLSKNLAKKVSLWGNGKKGTVAFVMKSAIPEKRGLLKYYLDTDFEGKRDFILLESDNGMRPDLLFDGDVYGSKEIQLKYADYRDEYTHDNVGKITLLTCGDVSNVRMSDIVAVEHSYEIIKNPALKIGDSLITFNCELRSTEYIEYDGETAKLIDEIGNERIIESTGKIVAPNGTLEAVLTCDNISTNPLRAQLTLGFEGELIS